MKMNPKVAKKLISKARNRASKLEQRYINEHAKFEKGELALYSFSDNHKDKIVKIIDIYVDEGIRIVYRVQEMVKGGYREKKNVYPYTIHEDQNELFKLNPKQKEG